VYVVGTATPAVIVAVTLSITRTHGYASQTAYVSCCFIIFTTCVVDDDDNDDDDDECHRASDSSSRLDYVRVISTPIIIIIIIVSIWQLCNTVFLRTQTFVGHPFISNKS